MAEGQENEILPSAEGITALKGFGRFIVIARVMLKHGMGNLLERLLGREEKKKNGSKTEASFSNPDFLHQNAFVWPWKNWVPVLSSWDN